MHRLLSSSALALLCGVATLPALAASSASSEASDSASTSVGASSNSFGKSSDSSSKDKKVAAGDYKVVEVAALADRPGMLRLKLQAVALADAAAQPEFDLVLPQAAADRGHVVAGAVITASERPYGLEFASAQTQAPFFLVLDDAWHRELNSRPVTL